MAKSKTQKEESLQELNNEIKTAKSVVFANFQGLKVKDSEALRRLCRAENITYVASKKSLLKKVLTAAGFSVDVENFEGGVAAVVAHGDEIAPAKVIAEFAKKNELVKIYGGILEGIFIDSNKVKSLATLSSKQQLLGQLVGTINAPVSGLVNVLAGNLHGLVNVLNNLKEAKS